jgi:hypothetical protein
LTLDGFLGSRYLRINHVRELLQEGRLDTTLRWRFARTVPRLEVRYA